MADLLAELSRHLDNCNPRAADVLEQIRDALGGVQQELIEQLTLQIDNFDFEEASQTLKALQTSLAETVPVLE